MDAQKLNILVDGILLFGYSKIDTSLKDIKPKINMVTNILNLNSPCPYCKKDIFKCGHYLPLRIMVDRFLDSGLVDNPVDFVTDVLLNIKSFKQPQLTLSLSKTYLKAMLIKNINEERK